MSTDPGAPRRRAPLRARSEPESEQHRADPTREAAGPGRARAATATIAESQAAVDESQPSAGEERDVVDLGSVEELSTGDSRAARRADQGGIPSAHMADEPQGEDSDSRMERIRAELASYAELRKTPYGLMPALLLGSITFFQIFDTQAFAVAAPEIVQDTEIDINTIVDIVRIVGLLAIFAQLWAGWYADRHRRVPFVAIGTIGSGVFSMLASRATSALTLGAPRVGDDVSNRASDVPLFSLYADYYPPEARGRVFALNGTLNRTAKLMAIFVAGLAVEVWGWRTALAVFGAPLIVLGVIALLKLPEPVRGYMERKALGADDETANIEDEPVSFGEAWRVIWGIRTLRRVFVANTIQGGAFAFSLFFGFFLLEEYGLSAFERSLVGLPAVLAGIVGGLWGGALIDRFTARNPGRVLTLIGGFSVISALGLLITAFQPPLIFLYFSNAVFGFGFALVGPAALVVYSQVLPPHVRTQGVQMFALSELPGLAVFSVVAQTVWNEYGYTAAFLSDIPFLLIGGLVFATAGSFFDLDARAAFASALARDEWRNAKREGRGKLLVCRDIDVEYSGVQVLFGVDIDIEEGDIVALLGTNGAGKSTLLRAISGTQQASGGAVVYDGRDITRMPPHEIAGRGIVHMPGGRGVFPGLTVRDNLLLANWLTEDPEEIKTRLAEVFEIFPRLLERIDAEARVLSGGEQQQLSLAQAFLANPKLLLIDELSLGLSPAVVAELLEIVREIHRRGVTIVVVEQSVNVALDLAEKAVFMEKGEVRFFGPTKDLLERPDILRAVYVKGAGAITEAPRAAGRSAADRRVDELAEARTVLAVDGLVKRYGGVNAVNHASFDLKEGQVLGLIGPNGAGKTTLFELISGYQLPDEGTVIFDGVDITHMTPEERSRRGLVRRFQDAALFGSLTVFETILVSLEKQLEVRSTLLNAFAAPQARRAERRLRIQAERLIDLLELGAYRDKFVKELSTGLRRIVDLACVIAADPKVLLLDEPSSGIAQAETESLGPLLRRIRFETGCSILIIEHDMPLISTVSDELIALVLGAPLMRGTPDEVLNDERVIDAYLGTNEATVKRSGRA